MKKIIQLQEEIINLQEKQIQLKAEAQKTSDLDKPKLKTNWLEEQRLKKLLNEKQSSLKSNLKKQQQKLSEQQVQKNRLSISEFSSGKIEWKLNERRQLYPEWNGYYNKKHVFTLKQGVLNYQLNLNEPSIRNKDFKQIQEAAEFFIENFTFKQK